MTSARDVTRNRKRRRIGILWILFWPSVFWFACQWSCLLGSQSARERQINVLLDFENIRRSGGWRKLVHNEYSLIYKIKSLRYSERQYLLGKETKE